MIDYDKYKHGQLWSDLKLHLKELDQGATRAVIDTARIDESTKKTFYFSINLLFSSCIKKKTGVTNILFCCNFSTKQTTYREK